jgi:hypothetical protein
MINKNHIGKFVVFLTFGFILVINLFLKFCPQVNNFLIFMMTFVVIFPIIQKQNPFN